MSIVRCSTSPTVPSGRNTYAVPVGPIAAVVTLVQRDPAGTGKLFPPGDRTPILTVVGNFDHQEIRSTSGGQLHCACRVFSCRCAVETYDLLNSLLNDRANDHMNAFEIIDALGDPITAPLLIASAGGGTPGSGSGCGGRG